MTDHTRNDARFARRRAVRRILFVILVAALVGGAYAFYLFNMPQRDVQATATDARIEAGALAQEFLSDANTANAKYLDAEGDSKVLEVSGTVSSIETDLSGQSVVTLSSEASPAGVRCSFTAATNAQVAELRTGDAATIKGVIRAGASYDPDLELYEHVVLEKCALVPSN
ncbi:MAG TPA: hypothetical protein PKE21_14580 [Flavobacteriales bacterium]|nr:hypothetical protein [Flavobacteriales bacterium]HMR28706.1 hypothetical protein [Flavobacteriales bacterium]